jgi:hypothetical protein
MMHTPYPGTNAPNHSPMPYGGTARPLSLESLQRFLSRHGEPHLKVEHFLFLDGDDDPIANALKEWLREEVLPAVFSFGQYHLPASDRDADAIASRYQRKKAARNALERIKARKEERQEHLQLVLLYLRSGLYCSQRELMKALPFFITAGTLSKWKRRAIKQGLITAEEWSRCFALARAMRADGEGNQ